MEDRRRSIYLYVPSGLEEISFRRAKVYNLCCRFLRHAGSFLASLDRTFLLVLLLLHLGSCPVSIGCSVSKLPHMERVIIPENLLETPQPFLRHAYPEGLLPHGQSCLEILRQYAERAENIVGTTF